MCPMSLLVRFSRQRQTNDIVGYRQNTNEPAELVGCRIDKMGQQVLVNVVMYPPTPISVVHCFAGLWGRPFSLVFFILFSDNKINAFSFLYSGVICSVITQATVKDYSRLTIIVILAVNCITVPALTVNNLCPSKNSNIPLAYLYGGSLNWDQYKVRTAIAISDEWPVADEYDDVRKHCWLHALSVEKQI